MIRTTRHDETLIRAQLDVPYRSEVVPFYLIIVGQQYDSFCHRLTDEKPVERIFVKLWERRDFECMLRFDGQFFIASIKQVPAEDACIDPKVVTSQHALDDNFPNARDAEVQRVVSVLDGRARFVG